MRQTSPLPRRAALRPATLALLAGLVTLPLAATAQDSPATAPAQSGAPQIGEAPAGFGTAPQAEDSAAPALPASDAAPAAEPAATPAAATTTATEAPASEVAPSDLPPAELPATELAPAAENMALPHDLSPWGMFMAADIIVKAVMSLLAAASLLTWTVLIFKLVEMRIARARVARAASALAAATSLGDAARRLEGRSDPGAWMAHAALEELKRSETALDAAGPEGVKERVHSLVDRTTAQAGRRLNRGTGALATIGSIAPFVGLFGTVWGIMNSFIGISQANTTNLAVVAPGIAEALLATAIGLVAAIPAVVIYNHFARAISGYRQLLGDVGAAVSRTLSRDLDMRRAARAPMPLRAAHVRTGTEG